MMGDAECLSAVDRHYGRRRRPTSGSCRSVAVRGAHGYQLHAPPPPPPNSAVNWAGHVVGGDGTGKHKRSEDYDDTRQRQRRVDSVSSRDSFGEPIYADGQVDRDGYTHIWERPLPPLTNRQQRHVTSSTAASMLVPVGRSAAASEGSSSAVYGSGRGGSGGAPPPPLPLPPPPTSLPVAVDCASLSPCDAAAAALASSGELSNYYQLDTKDGGDISPHE